MNKWDKNLSKNFFIISSNMHVPFSSMSSDLVTDTFYTKFLGTLPSRPDKKFFKRNLKNEVSLTFNVFTHNSWIVVTPQIQEYLQTILSNSELRKQPRIIDFFQPGEMVSTC